MVKVPSSRTSNSFLAPVCIQPQVMSQGSVLYGSTGKQAVQVIMISWRRTLVVLRNDDKIGPFDP